MATSSDLYLNELVYKSRENLLQMIEDRGFDVTDLRNYDSREMIALLERHQQNKFEGTTTLGPLDIKLTYTDTNNVDHIIIVKYRLDDKFKKSESLLKQITGIYAEHKLNRETDCLIILNIYQVLLRPGVKDDPQVNFVNSLKNMFVQFFGLKNFLINVSRHVLVPKHIIMTPDEVKRDLLDKYNTTLAQLPEILREDPQAKYIGLRPKQVVKIDSNNSTTGISIYYRICVKEQTRDN